MLLLGGKPFCHLVEIANNSDLFYWNVAKEKKGGPKRWEIYLIENRYKTFTRHIDNESLPVNFLRVNKIDSIGKVCMEFWFDIIAARFQCQTSEFICNSFAQNGNIEFHPLAQMSTDQMRHKQISRVSKIAHLFDSKWNVSNRWLNEILNRSTANANNYPRV